MGAAVMSPIRLPWQRQRTLLDYRRQGGRPPQDYEALTVRADRMFDLWRTINWSAGPSPVGRFGGQLDDRRAGDLRDAVDACAGARPVSLAPPAGASVERFAIGSRSASWSDDATPPQPWQTLAELVRRLVDTLTDSPVAALALRQEDGAVSLVRQGDAGLEVDLSAAVVRAIRWENGVAAERWTADLDGPRSVDTDAGWECPLPFDHPFAAGSVVTAHVSDVAAFDGQFWRSCSLYA